MATTAQQIFDIAMDLIDERLDTGTISDSDTITYKVKTPGILTTGQFELMTVGDLYKTFEISNKPIPNLYGLKAGFEVLSYEGEELTYPIKGSCKAYYFEATGTGTVYIEDFNGSWNTLATIVTNDSASFVAYKGVVTPTPGATESRMRFTGDYYYRFTNRALFAVPLQTDRVPDYRPWVKQTMPANFKSVDQIVKEHPIQQYNKDIGYKWEGRSDLYFDYHYEGNIRIVYKPVPVRLTSLADELEIDDVTATTVLPFYLATILMLDENPSMASYFNGRFEELKVMAATVPQKAIEEDIVNVYGGY